MTKEFNKGYMHPTRRKLVDMVLSGGEYDGDATFGYRDIQQEVKHAVGERWTDSDGKKWKQTDGGRVADSELSDIMADARAYLGKMKSCASKDCKTIKLGRVDKKLVAKTGYCLHCLTIKEAQIRYDGLWEVYADYKIYSNMVGHGRDVLANLNQSLKDVKQTYEYVNADGKLETWTMDRDANELRAEILIDITNVERELDEVIELRNTAWDKLKDKGYDLVKAPTD